MASCVTAVAGVAPCQCFSPGENQTTSPGPNLLNAAAFALSPATASRDDESLTERMRVPCSPRVRLESYAGTLNKRGIPVPEKSGSIRTVPVNQSDGLFADGCVPTRLISIF